MNNSTPQCDPSELWRPLTGMPDGAEGWRAPGYHELAQEWISIRAALKDQDDPRAFLDKWLEERGRAFAIETGQIEGLLPPPLINATGRDDYIDALEIANTGDLKAFSDYLGDLALVSLRSAVRIGRRGPRRQPRPPQRQRRPHLGDDLPAASAFLTQGTGGSALEDMT